MTVKNRASRNAPTIDLTAVKYIRIVIASYIMAVGLGVISGFDAHAYFSGFMAEPTALYLSKAFVIFCALMLFFGYFLRIVSLCLAIVILASSIQVNLMFPVQGSIDAFWADLVLICALLACYFPLSARQLRKQVLVKSAPIGNAPKCANGGKVVPRRVMVTHKPRPKNGGRVKVGQRFAPIASPEEQRDILMDRFAQLRPPQSEKREEVANIFA